ncbi:MAG: transporter substrate-binding domain-containing protein [Candidatus Polarisedimenticolia bacterium]
MRGGSALCRVISPRIAAAVAASLLFAAGAAGAAERRSIVVGCDASMPPFESLDAAGRPVGFNIDLMREAAAAEGIAVEFRCGDWGAVRRRFEAGEIDALSGLLVTPSRQRVAEFTSPHSLVTHAVFVRGDSRAATGEEALRSPGVVTQRGGCAWEWLHAHGATPLPAGSSREALQALARGDVEAAVLPRPAGQYAARELGLRGLKVLSAPIPRHPYAFAVHRGDAELLAALDEGLFLLKESGRAAELRTKYFAALDSADLPFWAVLRRALVIVVPIGLALIAAAGWGVRSLRVSRRRARDLEAESEVRRRVEASLRAREDLLGALCDHTPDTIFWIAVDQDGGFSVERINPALERAVGRGNADVAGRRLEDVLPPEVAARAAANYRRCVEAAASIAYEETEECSGRPRTWQTQLVPILDGAGRVRLIVGTSRDVTVARQSERILQQRQRLESLGVLAGGIAHDFNNLLGAVLGNINLAQLEEGPGREYLDNAAGATLRAAALTRQLLAYSGRAALGVRPLDVNQVVDEMVHLLGVSIPKNVDLRFDLAADLPAVRADAAQLQQVVMNLVTNAAESLGGRDGVVRLATRLARVDDPNAIAPPHGEPPAAGNFVVLEVRDDGCGMPQDVLQRIFDPFFTTKQAGRGLGLSAMLGILRGHRAGLSITSEPGRGSCFTLYFPAQRDAAPGDGPAPDEATLPKGLRALVADDEPAVRQALAAALRSAGCVVVEAEGGRDALARFDEAPDGFDVALVDLTMPDLDGRDVCRELRARRPSPALVLASGYDRGDVLRGMSEDLVDGFLQKPSSVQETRRVVAETLAKARVECADGVRRSGT